MTEPRPVAALMTCPKEDEYKEITVELEPEEITRGPRRKHVGWSDSS